MDLTNDILDAIEIIVNDAVKKMANDVSNGIVTGINSNGTYQVSFRNKSYALPLIGGNIPTVNSIVKVFVPKNKMSQAFIIY